MVAILFDDLGFSQLGCYGSDIRTPNIDRLAAEGLRYNRFHVTAMCTPSRASLLTGRNHHAVGMGFLCDAPMAYAGYDGRLPRSAATLPRLLRDAGYSTMAVGKWHLTRRGERTQAGPFDQWPLGVGFERFYGFLRSSTNQWAPDLVCDNHYVEPPTPPSAGYHLTEDLADAAMSYVLDQHHAAPGKPFFLYFAPGAMHTPHHAPRRWIDQYQGAYDDGWETWRDQAFAAQVRGGVVPESTTLAPRPAWIPRWVDLPPEDRRLYARMYEVYAAFLSHADEQIGRVLDTLEAIGELDNTVVLVLSDNGASAEAGQIGTANEHTLGRGMTATREWNQDHYEDWGGAIGYHHYAWGWAWAGNTPFRLWKRYTWLGGTRSPLIVHWPAGLGARGEVRSQFSHIIDLMPTILDLTDVEVPESVDGVGQQPLHGASLVGTFLDAEAPAPRNLQYFEMMGSRSIYADGWKATTNHISQGVADEQRLVEGSREFDQDRWELFELGEDFAEARDVADAHPAVLERLKELWFTEAGKYNVLPLSDALTKGPGVMIPAMYPPRERSVFRPGGAPISDEAIPTFASGARIAASVALPAGGAEGVLCAIGDWNNGFAMYVADGRLSAALAIVGTVTVVTARHEVGPGDVELATELIPRQGGGTTVRVLHGDVVVGEGASDLPLPTVWQHGGTALCLGRDRGLPVTDQYRTPFAWTGQLHHVTVEVPAGARVDPARLMGEALRAE